MSDTAIRTNLWASAVGWSAEEMCWLVLGFDPLKIDPATVDDDLANEHRSLHRVISGILDTRHDGSPNARRPDPRTAIQLLRLGGVEFPSELIQAVEGAQPSSSRSVGGETKRLKTARRLLLAMALDKYGYCPGSDAITRIALAAEKAGLKVSEGAVRDHLDALLVELDQAHKNDLFSRNQKKTK